MSDILNWIDQQVKDEFKKNRRVMSYDEYLLLVKERPEEQLRGSARYALDMMEHYGSQKLPNGLTRYSLFDQPIDGVAPKLVGHEEVQMQLHQALKSFSRQGLNNQLVLLHGPNGSAKSTIIHALMNGMERYSKEDAGAMYAFNWVFPTERITKGGIGIQSRVEKTDSLDSFAKIPDDEISARVPSELRDHPFLLIPQDQRQSVLEKLLGKERAMKIWEGLPNYLKKGDLDHRSKLIFEALLNANQGDYRKVLRHIQVERFFFMRRYRQGLVTIEPQMHVDAQYHLLSLSKSLSNLPASLQGLNLFTMTGDLVEGNRGAVEYSDLLKRPIDTFKYLLSACETGSVNVGSTIAYLDTLLLGSSNELQLDAFKEFPDFASFKGRMRLIRVPYLLSYSQEQQIYAPILKQFAAEKPVSPHTDWAIALWATLSRLKKPNSVNYPSEVGALVSTLSPLEKAKLLNSGEIPERFAPEERKIVKANLKLISEEYAQIPYYEGRMGASVRELKNILFDASQNPAYPCLSPLSVFAELDRFVQRVTEYEFLRQEVKDDYHDSHKFIDVVTDEYLNVIDKEVRDSVGLYQSNQWEDFMRRYVLHVSCLIKKEKIKNAITGLMENPDMKLIEEFEKIVDASSKEKDIESFRQNIITQVGAWSLDHPNAPVVYSQVFPDFWKRLERYYFETQKMLLTQMHDALPIYNTEGADSLSSDGVKLARKTVESMKSRFGYSDAGAKEVITFLMKKRY